MKQSHINVIVCTAFLVSVVIFILLGTDIWVLFSVIGVTSIIILLVGTRFIKTFIITICFIVLAFVLVYVKQSVPMAPGHIGGYDNEKVAIVGRIETEVVQRIDKQEVVVNIIGSSELRNVHGKLLVYAPLYPQYQLGDFVELSCKISSTNSMDVRSYARYLALRDIYAVCFWPKMHSIPAPYGYVPELFDRVKMSVAKKMTVGKELLHKKIEKLFPQPSASLLLGLLIGERASIPEDLKETLRRVGLSHIVAISGYNVSIVINIVFGALIFVGLWRKQAFWASLAFIFLFSVFVGAGASIVRASVMAALALTVKQVGRLVKKHLILLYTAVVMVAINPYVLLYDIGFHLSFSATFGLLYLEPVLLGYFEKVKIVRTLPEVVKESIITTFSAIAAVQPFITMYFSQFSLIALFANVLVLPIIPIIMLLGFVAVSISFVFFPLGKIVALGAYILLQYVEKISEILARMPFSLVTFEGQGIQYILLALNIGFIVFILWNHKKEKMV